MVIEEKNIQNLETKFLTSNPEMKKRLEEGLNITTKECEDFEW